VAQVVVGPGRAAHLEPVRDAIANPLTAEEREQLGAMLG